MQNVRLGKTNLLVSAVGFGGIPITRFADDASGAAVVSAAIEAGVTFIDTAFSYTRSEDRIGLAMRGQDRRRLIIATKDASEDGPTYRQHVEESLRRLGTDYLDIIQFHHISDSRKVQAIMAPGGAYEAACRLRDEGRARHIGVTCHNNALAKELAATGHFETIQAPINFVADEAEDLVARCREYDVGFIGMKPFAGGALEDGELALRYLQQFPTVVPVPGIETIDQLRQVIEVYNHPRPPTSQELRRMGELKVEIGKVFCRACGYCQPCPQKIDLPTVMRTQTLAKRIDEARARVMLGAVMPAVEKCTECGACLKKCPYHLEIPTMIRRAKAWYDEWIKAAPKS